MTRPLAAVPSGGWSRASTRGRVLRPLAGSAAPCPVSAAAVIARNASGEQQQGGIFVEEVLSPSLDGRASEARLRCSKRCADGHPMPMS